MISMKRQTAHGLFFYICKIYLGIRSAAIVHLQRQLQRHNDMHITHNRDNIFDDYHIQFKKDFKIGK